MMSRLLPIIIILLSIGVFVGYIHPTYTTDIVAKQEEIKQSDAALAAAADFKQKETQITADEAAIPADGIQRIEAFLPDGVDNVQLILDLNALAARSGVQLSNFNIKDNSSPAVSQSQSGPLALNSDGKTTDSLDLSVTATGTYSAFRTFLTGVEKSLRLLDVTQLKLDVSPTGVYSYTITFRIYWLH